MASKSIERDIRRIERLAQELKGREQEAVKRFLAAIEEQIERIEGVDLMPLMTDFGVKD